MTQPDSTPNTLPSHYVGIGASAGGLEAIEAFFSTLPPVNGLGLILIQHLSPDYKSLMVELLSKRTAMPVHRAEEGMVVEANCVYLIPPQKTLRIFHGKLLLTNQDHSLGLNLPIDIFLRSLAEDQGEKAIAVILSGTGSDGTRGIRAIKEAGGMAIVQEPETARFDGMPKSAIGTGLSDFVLAPQEMAEQLLSYSLHPYAVANVPSSAILTDEDGLARIFALLRESSKVDFTFYKPSTMIRRIERRMSLHQTQELREYVRYLEETPSEVVALYRELLIGVTSFFRDPEVFEVLRHSHLPDLLRRTGDGRELRFWVAGCSTGEEAYSLAILCREAMEENRINGKVRIFATDVDREAIERASTGLYTESIAGDIPARLLTKYFYRQGEHLHIARNIREMVVFAQHNLIKDPPFTNIDLVSCRNLLIYLQPILQHKVMEFFNFSLVQDGILLLGTSETVGDMADYFDPLHQKWRIFQTKGKRSGAALMLREAHTLHQPGRPMVSRPLPRHSGIWRSQEEERILDRLLQGLAGDHLPLVLLINEHLELLHVVGDSQLFLRVPTGKVVNDVSKTIADELVIPVSTGIQKVLKHSQDITFSNIRMRDTNGETLNVSMLLRKLPQRKGQDPLVAVLITHAARPPGSFEQCADEQHSYDLSKEAEQRINDLEQELQFTRENLQATIEELETSNEELQATNEELLASNEELQSTNEELQSVNEELFTVNAEYQSKINELTQANNDYDNLLTGIRIATLFLDENMKVRRFSPQMAEILELSEVDIDRTLLLETEYFGDLDIDRVIRGVMKNNQVFEREICNHQGRWFLLRALPYRIAEHAYSGVVVVLVDIHQVKEDEKSLRLTEERSRFVTSATGIGLWDWEIASGTLHWSETLESVFGFAKDDFGSTYEEFLACVHADDRPMLEQAVDAALAGTRDYHLVHRIIWPDGSVHEVEESGKVLRDEGGCPQRMIGIVRSLDLEKSALRILEEKARKLSDTYQLLNEVQQEVHQRETMFQNVLDAVPMGIGLALDTTIQWVNSRVCELTGYSLNELRGREICSLCHPKVGGAGCGDLLHRARLESINTTWQHKNGSELTMSLSTVPVEEGKPEAGIAFLVRQQ